MYSLAVQLKWTVYFIFQCHLMQCHFLIFTGLPKAAVITHLQSLKAAAGFWAFGATEDDVVYIPLPLYHSAASLIGIGGTIELGRPHNLIMTLIIVLILCMHYMFKHCFHCVKWNLTILQTTIQIKRVFKLWHQRPPISGNQDSSIPVSLACRVYILVNWQH